MVGQRVTVLLAFVTIVLCSADLPKPKEPPQPTVHVYAVPTFSLKPTSAGQNKHYIVKEGSNVSLTCEIAFTEKNILIAWVHPKADNEVVEKQIHSRHEGKNIKERILHIYNARQEDSGSYTCHTRRLHQRTWSSPNTFIIQVGEELKIENVDTKNQQKSNPKGTDTTKVRNAAIPLKKMIKTPTANSTNSSNKITSISPVPSVTTTSKVTTKIRNTTTTTTKATMTTTTLPQTSSTESAKSTQNAPSSSNQFNVASFLGGMALVVGIVLLVKMTQAIIHKRRQQSYGYLNM